MKQFTRTITLASTLTVFAAGQFFYPQADIASKQAVFRTGLESSIDLEGMDCVAKKLILPEKPEEPDGPVQFLQNALARYGE